MVIKEKYLWINDRKCRVQLRKEDGMYIVKVGNEVYKKTANQLFAVQVFNAI